MTLYAAWGQAVEYEGQPEESAQKSKVPGWCIQEYYRGLKGFFPKEWKSVYRVPNSGKLLV
jgi:hypothetical protein